jgi:type IV secretory pathway TraG/TraD family ATPase VirD4
MALGTAAGAPVVLPLEDHALIVAPTGAGKTRDLMIPAALTAPGPLIVTCTRADILDVIATERAGGGQVHVFDVLGLLGWPDPTVWNPVAGARHGERAVARGRAFAGALDVDHTTSNAGFFRANAAAAWGYLLHAADLASLDVAAALDWAAHLSNGAVDARQIIATSADPLAEPAWAANLASIATGADDTVAASRQTLQQAVEPLALRSVLTHVIPRAGAPLFDPHTFVTSARPGPDGRRRGGDTLVLVADQNASTNVAPLCAMLLQEVIDTAKRVAKGGRLDPPIRLVGDEIANVAPLPKLPDLGTDARGFGLQLVLAIQSIPQAERRWGAAGAKALLDNMNAEIVLGGLSDPATLERYATLVGEVELTRHSANYDALGRGTGAGAHTADRKALRADEIRRIPDGHGLLIYRNRPAAMLAMTPWYATPDGPGLQVQRAATQARRLADDPGEDRDASGTAAAVGLTK